jgi:hypothetical protein
LRNRSVGFGLRGSGAGNECDRSRANRRRWLVDFLGPATFVCSAAGFSGSFGKLPASLLEQLPPGLAGQMRQMAERMATILPLLDDGRINLPCNVVHATKAHP